MDLAEHVLEVLDPVERAETEAKIAASGMTAGIEYLLNANRADRSATREIALRNLSVAEGVSRQQPEVAGEFSIDGPDILLPRTEHNLPFIPAAELSVETIRAGLRTGGCLLVKGLLGAAQIEELTDEIDQAIAAERLDADEQAAATSPSSTFHRNERMYGRNVMGPLRALYDRDEFRLLVDSPHALFTVLEMYRQVGLLSVIEEHLGMRPALAAEKATLRRVNPEGLERTGWHQDGAFLGESRVLNAWLALSDCGVEAPGLQVVSRRLDGVVPGDPAWKDTHMHWIVSEEEAERLGNEEGGVWVPTFEPGDCLLFDGLFLHRTARRPGMTKRRYAIETWFFDPASLPDKYLPMGI